LLSLTCQVRGETPRLGARSIVPGYTMHAHVMAWTIFLMMMDHGSRPDYKVQSTCSHRRHQLTRRVLGNAHHEGLEFYRKTTMEVPESRRYTTYPGSCSRGGGSLSPANNPLYEYMCTGAAIGGVVVSSLVLVCGLRYLGVASMYFCF
jgi:hypothetical protein